MSQNDIARDMTQGPVLRQLAIFAIPVALANALQAIYSMVDMVVVGQVVGSSGLSAVGIGGQLLNMFLCIGMGFSFGAQILLSQQVGAKDHDHRHAVHHRAHCQRDFRHFGHCIL